MTIKWTTITIETASQAVEAINGILNELGAEGTEIQDALDVANYQKHDESVLVDWQQVPHLDEGAKVTAYFNEQKDVQQLMDALSDRLKIVDQTFRTMSRLTTEVVEEQNWADNWKQYYEPVKITNHMTIVPNWLTYQAEADEQLIHLDPQMAFGTGSHATTKLALQALEKSIQRDDFVIDVGTGSGILAIGAALLGARNVLATDIDDMAVSVSQANINLNHVKTKMDLQVSDLLKDVQAGEADLIVANILPDVIERLIPELSSHLRKDGIFIASGILERKGAEIKQQLIQHDFEVIDEVETEGWVALSARLK